MYKWLITFICLPMLLAAQDLDRLQVVLEHSFSEVATADLERAIAKIELLEKRNGLRFRSAATRNDYAGLELGNVWRVSGGLSVDFLESGLLERKKELELSRLDKDIVKAQMGQKTMQKNYGYLFNYFIYLFNIEKQNLLQQKNLVLESLINKNYDLYYNHELSYDEILYLQSLRDESKIMLKSMSHLNSLFESLVNIDEIPTLSVRALPIMEIDVDEILEHDPFAYLDDISDLQKQRKVIQQELTDQQSLGVYYNLHYRPDFEGVERSGFFNNFGIRYTTPLRFDNEEERKLVAMEHQRIDEFQEDYIFNEKKELINYILEYDTKLRQYSNFLYKLKKLKEQQRVENAIQRVSTLQAESRRDWKIDLEILNVQYEILDLKQLLYLGLLRIYNKAKIQDISSYTKVMNFDESQERFPGNRVLKITEKRIDQYQDQFVIDYLQKNNFKLALWLSSEPIPQETRLQFYTHGIEIIFDPNELLTSSIIEVPVPQFGNRGDLELWIDQMNTTDVASYLIFDSIEDLLILDSKTLAE